MSYDIDTEHPVLVTGATGYIAGWIVKRLRQAGVTVHGAVRNASSDKAAHLRALGVELFEADLLRDGSYAEAMAGCRVVFHTASPVKFRVEDPQRDLVEPAVAGTRNVLATAAKTASVRRVVLTSSCAAIYGSPQCVLDAPGGVLTEACWNARLSLETRPYFVSKTLAERAAWDVAKEAPYTLVSINPAFVVGPSLNHATSGSFDAIRALISGSQATGIEGDMSRGVVDVRDVAEAQLAAAYTPAAEGRFIVTAVSHSFGELAEMLRGVVKDELLPPPKPFEGVVWRADNSKSRNVLSLTYRPIRDGLVEMVLQIQGEAPSERSDKAVAF